MAIAGFVLSFLCGLLGLIFSAIALNECKKSKGLVKGEGLAIAGIAISIATLVLGVLAAIAIPSFMGYMHKAKRSEAQLSLDRLGRSIRARYIETAAFPDATAPLTPERACCEQPMGKCPSNFADWTAPAWQDVDFAPFESGRFQYRYTSTAARFEAEAIGDLDCDGTMITYRLVVDAVDGNPHAQVTPPTTQD